MASGTYKGIVNFNQIANFGTGSAMTISGAELQYASSANFIGSTDLTASKIITVNDSGATIDTNGNAVTYAGNLASGAGGVTFVDSAAAGHRGSVNLQHLEAYTGFTTVGSGATVNLDQNGSLASGAGTIVASGGTLTGGQSFATNAAFSGITQNAGALTLQSGGTIAPGNTAGAHAYQIQGLGLNTAGNGNQVGTATFNVMNATGLQWYGGGQLNFALDNTVKPYTGPGTGPGTALSPSASTTLNLGEGALVEKGIGTYVLNFQNTGAWDNASITGDTGLAANVYDLINFGGKNSQGIAGNVLGSNGDTNFNINDFSIENLNGVGTLSWYYNPSGDNNLGQEELLLTVVPEPSTWAMLVGGLITLIFWTRRRANNRRAAFAKTK